MRHHSHCNVLNYNLICTLVIKVFEIQGIKCTATSGTLSLSFRSESMSSSLAYNAAPADLEAALEGISQVRTLYGDGVTVSYSSGTSLCTSDGSNIASVTFTQALGDLPLMAAGGTSGLSAGASVVISWSPKNILL